MVAIPAQKRLVLMGKMAAGKTMASELLAARHHATTWTPAARIKQVSAALLAGDVTPVLEEMFPGRADLVAVTEAALTAFAGTYAREKGKPRYLLQAVGDVVRDAHPDTALCWEEDLERRICATDSPLVVVDIRSVQSYEFFVGRRGYVPARVDASEATRRRRLQARDTHVPIDPAVFVHPTETAVDTLHFEHIIDNDTDDTAALAAQLDAVVACL